MRTVTANGASRSFTKRTILITDRNTHFDDVPGVGCLVAG